MVAMWIYDLSKNIILFNNENLLHLTGARQGKSLDPHWGKCRHLTSRVPIPHETEQENLYWFLKKQWKHVEELGPIVVVGSAIVIAGIRVVVDGGHEVFKLP